MNVVDLLPALVFLGIRNRDWAIIIVVVVVILVVVYMLRARRR
jgi:hypothetical protein